LFNSKQLLVAIACYLSDTVTDWPVTCQLQLTPGCWVTTGLKLSYVLTRFSCKDW